MREYLELEFFSVKEKLPFKFDLENIIDDWVSNADVNVIFTNIRNLRF